MKKTVLAYLATASTALAHSGHEAALLQGADHWLTQSDHLAVVLTAGGLSVLGLAALVRGRFARRRALRE